MARIRWPLANLNSCLAIALAGLTSLGCATGPGESGRGSGQGESQSQTSPEGDIVGSFYDQESLLVVHYRSRQHPSGVVTVDASVNGKGISLVVDSEGHVREMVGQTTSLTEPERKSLARASDAMLNEVRQIPTFSSSQRQALQGAALTLSNL
jgi:hypothetical protein